MPTKKPAPKPMKKAPAKGKKAPPFGKGAPAAKSDKGGFSKMMKLTGMDKGNL